MTKTINQLIFERILILDGAFGTQLQKHNLTEHDYKQGPFKDFEVSLAGNMDILNIIRPDIVRSIHDKYLVAGADIIETNTFSANKISQSEYQCEEFVFEINREGAKIAKEIALEYSKKDMNKPRFVAGSLGPTSKMVSMSGEIEKPEARSVDYDQMKEVYYEAAMGLIAGGIDVFLIETIIDTLNAKAAISAIKDANKQTSNEIPIIISFTITDLAGRTLSGQTTEAFFASIDYAKPLALGINCSLGPNEIKQYLIELDKVSHYPIIVYPNAGLPDGLGEYKESPESMARYAEEWAKEGLVNIIGSCCGSSDKHSLAIAKACSSYKPRASKKRLAASLFAGIEALIIYDSGKISEQELS